VGFETIRYYLTINTIKDLYCDVLRKIATTCDNAVTNCHGIYFPHFQSEILPKMPSPFEIKVISIRPPGFEFPRESGHLSRRGATFENGRGQVLGGQPGTPIEPPIQRIDSRSVGRSYLLTARKQYVYPDSYRGYGDRPAPPRVRGTTGFGGN